MGEAEPTNSNFLFLSIQLLGQQAEASQTHKDQIYITFSHIQPNHYNMNSRIGRSLGWIPSYQKMEQHNWNSFIDNSKPLLISDRKHQMSINIMTQD